MLGKEVKRFAGCMSMMMCRCFPECKPGKGYMPMDGSRLDEASNSTRAPGQKARAAGQMLESK